MQQLPTDQKKTGILLSYLSVVISALVGIAYVPMLIQGLSTSEYGLFQMTGSLLSNMLILDFGLSGTVIRYYCSYSAKSDEKSKENTLAYATIIYAVLDVAVLLIGILVLKNVELVFGSGLTPHELVETKRIIRLIIITCMFMIPGNIFSAVIIANERFAFSRAVLIIQSLLKPLAAFLILLFQSNAYSIVFAHMLVNLVIVLCNVAYCFRYIDFKVRFHFWDRALLRSMIVFSFFMFLSTVSDELYWKTGQIVLGVTVGTREVAIFGTAYVIIMEFRSIAGAVHGIFLPRLTYLSALGEDMTEINHIFCQIGEMSYLIMALILTGFGLFGKAFILLWAGDLYVPAYAIAIVVMSSLFIPSIQTIGISVLRAQNKQGFRASLYLALSAINVAIGLLLSKRLGGLGYAIATSVCMFIGNVLIMNIYYHVKLKMDIQAFFKKIWSLVPPTLLAVGIGLAIQRISLEGWLGLGVKVSLYTAIYVLCMLFFGINSANRRALLVSIKGLLKGGSTVKTSPKE